jgi:hypothetical protein
MVKHRLDPNYDFWKMLKVGYDNFEVTKRPPEVNVCEKKYVFNQQISDGGSFNPAGKCPAMSTPPALTAALASYGKTYDADYQAALKKYDGLAWYDPTEAERKAVVAKLRKGRELAYAPTGTSLEAGRMVKVAELEELMANQAAKSVAAKTAATATPVTQAQATTVAAALPANIPVPTQNPLAYAAPEPSPQETADATKKPFWKFWARN